jgi:hypothetical protein
MTVVRPKDGIERVLVAGCEPSEQPRVVQRARRGVCHERGPPVRVHGVPVYSRQRSMIPIRVPNPSRVDRV